MINDKNIKSFYSRLSESDYHILSDYLESRIATEKKTDRINVVLDLLHDCELNCIGCGTNAHCIRTDEEATVKNYLTFENIQTLCRKIKRYADEKKMEVFVNLGGGEPFLRKDIKDIILIFYKYFGKSGVGIDTNAALSYSFDAIKEVLDYVSYLGISLNGLREYNNWWANSNIDAYENTIATIEKLCALEGGKYRDIIEVTSVATKKNIEQLPSLMTVLADKGVKYYSVHRAIPVGRMSKRLDLIPDNFEYLQLFIELIKTAQQFNIDFHIHHSIENIHRALIHENNTFYAENAGQPNKASSIGINTSGDVVFDAWCMVGAWKKLSCGNLIENDLELKEIFNNVSSDFNRARAASSMVNRCNGCRYNCSGGSRIVAAFTQIALYNQKSITVDDLLNSFKAIDPACPLYNMVKDI